MTVVPVALPVDVIVQLVLGAGLAGALCALMLAGLGRWFLRRVDTWLDSTASWQRVEARIRARVLQRQQERGPC